MSIPVQNVYYLLSYAWDKLEEAGVVPVLQGRETTLADLFAHVLAGGTTHLLKRGLDRGYVSQDEEIRGIRGKLEMSTTIKRALLPQARTSCSFDDLSYGILHNQILKSTLRALSQIDRLHPDLHNRVVDLVRRLGSIPDIRLSRHAFQSVQLHRNNRYYAFLLNICRLVYDSLMVEEQTGLTKFRDFTRDERRMARLFEKFVFNFYKREQSRYTVHAPWIDWHSKSGDPEHLSLLPRMMTDVVLHSPSRTLIIDTKYYHDALTVRRGKARIRSAHLYQLFSYIQNFAPRLQAGHKLEGMLLYPLVQEPIVADFTIEAHSYSVRTIDLRQPWPEVHRSLLLLLGDVPIELPWDRP